MTTFEQYFNLYLVVCGSIVNILAAVLVLWWWLTDDEIPKQMPDGMALDGEIDTALIFGTLKGLPAQLPESVEAFWIENGASGQIAEAA